MERTLYNNYLTQKEHFLSVTQNNSDATGKVCLN